MKKEIIRDFEKLGERCKEFNVLQNQDLVEEIKTNLIDTINDSDRLFLTACEIGYDERALAMKFKDDVIVAFNPAFRSKKGVFLDRELDVVTGKEYFVPRYAEVEAIYQNERAEVKAYKLNEGASVVFCQAMDLVNGLLTTEYGLEIIPEFDTASKEEQQEVISAYVKSLEDLGKELDNELMADSEGSQIWGAAKFIKAANAGDIEFEQPEMSNREKKKLARLSKDLKAQANKLKFWNKIKKEKKNG